MSYPFLGIMGMTNKAWHHQKYAVVSSVALAFLQYVTTSVSSFTLLSTGTVDYEVDWGDGTTESLTTNNPTHTYSSAGVYTIKVTPAEGSTYSPYYNNDPSAANIASVSSTGGSQLADLERAWYGASNMTTFSGDLDTSHITDNGFERAWRDCSSLTSFPLIDTSGGTVFATTWRNCSGLTSFPQLDFSSGTYFFYTWRDCTSLTTFPANMFDTTGTLTTFSNAWTNCALTAQSIENILVSLDTNGASNISLGIGGGTNAAKTTWSAAANTAYDNLIAKGWTISYNA